MRYFVAFALLSMLAVPVLAATTQEVAGDPGTSGPIVPVTPWERPTAVLFDQSDLVTCAGCGAGGADASEVQTALGMSLYGFGHQHALGYAMADDFDVPAGETWSVDGLSTFAYQTGSGTVSTITGVFAAWYDGMPGAGGNIIAGDYTTNIMSSTAWTNIYRVLDTAITNTQRPVMGQESAPVGVVLTEGTYWVGWNTDGTGASGPWVPPLTLVGQTTTGNCLQSLDGGATWAPGIDSGSGAQQGMPFIVSGTTGGATPTVEKNWSSLKGTFTE